MENLSENFQFLEVKFSIYLNRHVFVMCIQIEMTEQSRPRSVNSLRKHFRIPHDY